HVDVLHSSVSAVEEATRPALPHLAAFTSAQERERLAREFDSVNDAGGKIDYEFLSGQQLREFEPVLTEDITAGIAIHGQRFINPPRYMASPAHAVERRGATIECGFDVTDLQHSGAEVMVASSTGHEVRADHAVIATGA